MGVRWGRSFCCVVAALLVACPVATAAWTSGTPHGLVAPVLTDPSAPGRWYIGPAGFGEGEALPLYVTEDRGATWAERRLPIGTGLPIAYASPPGLLVTIDLDGAVYRSANQARSWTLVGCCAIAADTMDSQRLIGEGADDGFSRSVDGGVTWQPITSPPTPASDTTFAFDAAGVVWARSSTGIVARSSDIGTTWQIVTGVPHGELLPGPDVPSGLWIRAWRSVDGGTTWQWTLPKDRCELTTVSPTAGSPLTAWMNRCGEVRHTIDGGATWQVQAEALAVWPFIPLTVVDGGARAIAAGDDGPWLLEPGATPRYLGSALPAVVPGEVVADPVVAGRAFSETFMTTDAGATWRPSPGRQGSVARVAGRLLTDALDGVWSRPVGSSAPASLLTSAPHAVIGEPRGKRAWIVTPEKLYRTDDGVHLTQLRARGLPHLDGDAEEDEFAVVAAGGGGRTIIIAARSSAEPFVAISRDGGASFRLLKTNVDPDALEVDAVDRRLILTFDSSGRLRRSLDAGLHFTTIARDVGGFAVDPTRRGVWYAVRSRRLYVTRNAGRTWRPLPAPPGGPATGLAAGAGRLWATTRVISSTPLPR